MLKQVIVFTVWVLSSNLVPIILMELQFWASAKEGEAVTKLDKLSQWLWEGWAVLPIKVVESWSNSTDYSRDTHTGATESRVWLRLFILSLCLIS